MEVELMVATRPVLERMHAYIPGRTPQDIARAANVTSPVRLGSNESAFAPLPSVVEAMQRAARDLNRYPDFYKRDLVAALADRFAVPTETINVSTGSMALLSNIHQALVGPGDEVVFGWRSFEAYPGFSVVADGTPVKVPLRDQVHDLAAMAAAVTQRTRMLIVCNPNNPTGTTVSRTQIEALIASLPAAILVVIDEAYIEFADDPQAASAVELTQRYDNVAVLRTFSKAYGLAGARIGYAISSRSFAAKLSKLMLQFGANSVGLAGALAVLDDNCDQELMKRLDLTRMQRRRVTDGLRANGIEVVDSQANFVFLPLEDRSSAFASALESHGVIVRALGDDGVRITIGTVEENDSMLAAVSAVFLKSTAG